MIRKTPRVNTKVKVYDARKYTASCSHAETILVDLISSENWISSASFFKIYLAPTEPLRFLLSLPVSDPSDSILRDLSAQ